MTQEQFWGRLMPTMGPLSNRDGALAFAYVMDRVRDRVRDQEIDVDEAEVDALRDELHQRFYVPLS
jgi:hypothetical protein